jgi:hypothetical protein
VDTLFPDLCNRRACNGFGPEGVVYTVSMASRVLRGLTVAEHSMRVWHTAGATSRNSAIDTTSASGDGVLSFLAR